MLSNKSLEETIKALREHLTDELSASKHMDVADDAELFGTVNPDVEPTDCGRCAFHRVTLKYAAPAAVRHAGYVKERLDRADRLRGEAKAYELNNASFWAQQALWDFARWAGALIALQDHQCPAQEGQ